VATILVLRSEFDIGSANSNQVSHWSRRFNVTDP
jgi:hypothetical protein